MDPVMALQYTKYGPLHIGYILHSMQQKWDHGTLGTQRSPFIGYRTRLGASMDHDMALNTPNMALYILAIFLHSMQQKRDQGTLGTQRSTLIVSRTHLGPSMVPAMALQYTKHGPLYIGYVFNKYNITSIR